MIDEAYIEMEALNHFGVEAQKLMCIEEMSELTKELCKHSRGKENIGAIAEEIADVFITVNQMIMAFDIERDVCEHKRQKLARLCDTLGAASAINKRVTELKASREAWAMKCCSLASELEDTKKELENLKLQHKHSLDYIEKSKSCNTVE